MLQEKRKKFCYKSSVKWCNEFKGSDELHTLNSSGAVFTSWGDTKQSHRRKHSEPICALTLPIIISKCPPLRGFSTDDSSKFRRENYRGNADYISEGGTRPVSAATAINVNGVVSSHLVLTCHSLLKHHRTV